MNNNVVSRATKVLFECKNKGEYLYFKYSNKPIFFCSLWNKKGDLASISENAAIIEPLEYAPTWSAYIKNWAKQEGFSQDRIENQDLSKKVSLEEIVDFFTDGN